MLVTNTSHKSSFPPSNLKIYAPNGDTKLVTGSVSVRPNKTDEGGYSELVIQHRDGTFEVINKKAVIKNMDTGIVAYNPRCAPMVRGPGIFMTRALQSWLLDNPTWPAILELWDDPVGDEEVGNDGINA